MTWGDVAKSMLKTAITLPLLDWAQGGVRWYAGISALVTLLASVTMYFIQRDLVVNHPIEMLVAALIFFSECTVVLVIVRNVARWILDRLHVEWRKHD